MVATWWDEGACVGMNPEIWHPNMSVKDEVQRARDICDTCPVRSECLDYAQTTRINQGIWGGLTPRQREYRRRHPNGRRRTIPSHATRARYNRGCRCDDCHKANAHYLVRRRTS